MTGVRHIDKFKTEILFLGSGTATGSTQWIDLALYSHVTFIIGTSNSSGTPAATYTIYQGLNVAGSSSKGLSPPVYFTCNGFATSSSSADNWSSVSLAASSFAATSTVSTLFGYMIEVHDTDLDLNNLFKTVQIVVTGASSITQAIFAHCFPRFGANYAAMPSALT